MQASQANVAEPLQQEPAKKPTKKVNALGDKDLRKRAYKESFKKLDLRTMAHNPVMLTVEVGSILTTIDTIRYLFIGPSSAFSFTLQITIWLWLTVLFANFAEAIAEGSGQAQADALRKTRTDTDAKRETSTGEIEIVSASDLQKGDIVVLEVGDIIPGDGQVVEGIAAIDESAITGESAPVIRESGGDRDAVTGGTRVISDRIRVQITATKGNSFLDKMIALIEGAKRQKTPNEIALSLLLAGLTLIFLVVVITLAPIAAYSKVVVSITIFISLLVCLIPTTIGGLLSAIGISGMNRLLQANVLALSGRAVEAAGDVNIVLLDKTGTLTLGNRHATEFIPTTGVTEPELAQAAFLSSLADETPEGRSIVDLAKNKFNLEDPNTTAFEFVPFTAQTRMSGVNFEGQEIRKGAVDSVLKWVGSDLTADSKDSVESISRSGGTPLLVAKDNKLLGVVHLKDVVKQGISERLEELRKGGIRTVMITGDNPMTAAAIAKEVGVDDFLAEATPERKMEYIKEMKAEGYMVGMVGDGTNDAPALAQADLAVAMNSGTMAAREAGNMIDLDSSPTKLIEIVEVGKQILITRGALTTFSLANDVAKYFAIIPAMFILAFPGLQALNIMRLTSPESAILSAVIFNAIIIPILIPLALRGVKYRPAGAGEILRRNILFYGVGGLIIPFAGIKLIDMLVTALHLVSLVR